MDNGVSAVIGHTEVAHPPIVAFFDPTKDTIIYDASSQAFGAVLGQKHGTEEPVVEFPSRLVPTQGRARHANELESLAMHWAITERFRLYLQGLQNFTVYTDNWTAMHLGSRPYYHVPLQGLHWILLNLTSPSDTKEAKKT